MTIIMTSRRSIIKGLTSLVIAAPVIIKPENLMMIDSPQNRLVASYTPRDYIDRIDSIDYNLYRESIVNYISGANIVAKMREAEAAFGHRYQLVRKAQISDWQYSRLSKEDLAYRARTAEFDLAYMPRKRLIFT